MLEQYIVSYELLKLVKENYFGLCFLSYILSKGLSRI